MRVGEDIDISIGAEFNSVTVISFQFSSLHTRGSSHGGSRITRRAYNEPFYVHMMDEAYRMWDQIEREGKTQLYTYVCVCVCVLIKRIILLSVVKTYSDYFQ